MQWYYSKNGVQLGPISDGEIRGKIASGEILMTDLIWREGMRDWLPAAQVSEFSLLSAAATPPAEVPPLFGGSPVSPYSPPSTISPQMGNGANIPNYLWQSIVVTIFCCWPFGIPAIVYAAKVDGLKARGDIAGAMAASASAKTWCMVSAGIVLGFAVLWLIAAAIGAATSN
ncbi:MAG: CD225/dispanin family protein [Luteolibacter sp.]